VLQQGTGANAGELQQLRRIDGAGAHDDFPSCNNIISLSAMVVTHADGPPAIEKDFFSERIHA
jgi:hypothetical protein